MFDIATEEEIDGRLLSAILNSTVVALWKTFYGRYTGTEGSLDTEVIDVRMLEVPDPRRSSSEISALILQAFDRLACRPIGRLVEEGLMDCHSPDRAEVIASEPLNLADELCRDDRRALDDAVFELLGVKDAGKRQDLVIKLYKETAHHFRKSASSKSRSRSSAGRLARVASRQTISPMMPGMPLSSRMRGH
jgi:hypothetical protein